MLYQKEAPGDWGQMEASSAIKVATEMLAMADGCKLFLRSWVTDSSDVLLILHGLGGHSGWYINMGDTLAARGLTVYADDHRGFGHSEGLPGHIDKNATYVEDCHALVSEIHRRHPDRKIYVLGHSMGGIFTTHLAAKYGQSLAGILYLNPWVEDSSRPSPGTTLSILVGGLFKLAKQIALPVLVMQAGQDKAILASGTRKLYEAFASSDKTWKGYEDFSHDSEFEEEYSRMDSDIAVWISKHASS